MGAGSHIRKEFKGGAPAATLSGSIDDDDVSFSISDATGWPVGTNPFVIAIDRGLANEEKMLVTTRVGTTLSAITRGYDDTTAFAHGSGATVEHVLDASTIDQVNRAANLLTTLGDLMGHNGTNTARVPGGTVNGQVLMRNDGAATGVEFDILETVAHEASAPVVNDPTRIWFDETTNQLRSSDGTEWKLPADVKVYASAGARTTALGGDPNAGMVTAVGTGESLVFEVYDGSSWIRIARSDEGIPKFADAAARDAYITSPTTGDHAYLTGSHALTEYRNNEWITINQKSTVSDVQPTGPIAGDLWLQPIS